MAKTATKTKMVSGKKTAAGKGKTVTTSSVSQEDLSDLVAANIALEGAERAKTGSNLSFITLVKANSGIIDQHSPAYIKGVKALDYAISSKKIGLGKSLDATIIGMFKVYGEVAKKEKESDLPKTVRFWTPDDAQNFPVSGLFDRELPNGNILQPRHWVFLYLHDHPEIEDGLISFQGKGNKFYTELEKLVKAESSLVTELRFKITNQAVVNEAYKKTDYYPKFEIVGRNFKIGEDGKVMKLKDSDLDAATLKDILSRSHQMYEDYTKLKLVGKQNITALLGTAGRPALSAGNSEYEEDDEDEAVNF